MEVRLGSSTDQGDANQFSSEEEITERNDSLLVCNTQNLTWHISQLFNDQETSDIVISVNDGNQTFHLHKMVLCQSPVFKSMLYGGGWRESSAQTISICEDVKYVSSIHLFFQYLYGVAMAINWDNVESLAYYGDKYVVDYLLDDCLNFLSEQVEKNGDLISALNGWKMVRKVLTHQQQRLATLQSIIYSNFEQVMRDNNIVGSLDIDDIRLFMMSDKIVCRTEFAVYKLLENWLLMQEEHVRFSLFTDLSRDLRLSYMFVQELSYVDNSARRLFSEEASENFQACQTHIKVLLCDAYKYHLFKQAERLANLSIKPPRLYLDGGACLKYRLLNMDGLTTWTKMTAYFEVRGSLSSADSIERSFCVTLMRKINAGTLHNPEKNRLSLLSLEINQLTNNPLPFTKGLLYILERHSETVLRRPLTQFDITDGLVKNEIKLEDINFDDVLKKSVYQYDDENGVTVYLAIDIFLQ